MSADTQTVLLALLASWVAAAAFLWLFANALQYRDIRLAVFTGSMICLIALVGSLDFAYHRAIELGGVVGVIGVVSLLLQASLVAAMALGLALENYFTAEPSPQARRQAPPPV